MLRRGWRVIVASNGREAVESFAADASVIDVVVLDVRMPALDGMSVLKAILKVNPDIPHFVMTAHQQSSHLRVGTPAGTTRVLEKPFELDEFVQIVEELADSPTAPLRNGGHFLAKSG